MRNAKKGSKLIK
jgi:hypothetical protein